MNRREVLATISAATIGASLGSAAEPERAEAGLKGVPVTTVEELVTGLRKEGFQWSFVGKQITFSATVVTAGATPKVRVEGMDKNQFDTAIIHNAAADNRFKVSDKVQVRGLIVDQWYGLWQVWRYEMKLANA